MPSITTYVGIDIGAASLALSRFTGPGAEQPGLSVRNDLAGFESLNQWLHASSVSPQETVVCMEHTGIYGEALCYFLYQKGYRVVLEAPQRIKRAFCKPQKNDPVDAAQIAEYGYRFFDQLRCWQPQSELLEQVKTLLSLRKHWLSQLKSNEQLLRVDRQKHVATPLAQQQLQTLCDALRVQLKTIEQELQQLFAGHPVVKSQRQRLDEIPGVGVWLAYQLFVLTAGFRQRLQANTLACYIGIAPHEYRSGSSVYRKPKSRQSGHGPTRKLLRLAAMSLATHHPEHQRYYQQKVAQGKAKALVLNNLENKI